MHSSFEMGSKICPLKSILGSKQELAKLLPLAKMAANHGDVLIHLKYVYVVTISSLTVRQLRSDCSKVP